MAEKLPLIILAGSDKKPGAVPPGFNSTDMLSGNKGLFKLSNGRCIAAELVERFRMSGYFEEPIIVGPGSLYEGNVDCEIVNIEGDLPNTLACVRALVKDRFEPLAPVAFSTYDILPTVEDIQRLMSESYEPCKEVMFWGQLIEAEPSELGASSWKPVYQLRSGTDNSLETFYPGHLVIVRPGALRVRLTNHLLQLAYRFRNLDIRKRALRTLFAGLGQLILQDLKNLRKLQLPILSIGIPYLCVSGYFKFRTGRLSVADFSSIVAKIFVHRDFHDDIPGSPAVFSSTRVFSFAKDIDSKQELEEQDVRDS